MNQKYGTLIPTGRLLDGKPRTILFDATKCIGCRQCVQACKDWNDHPRTTLYELSSTTWITMEPPVLEGLSPIWTRNSCMHCEFPMCTAVCPVEAITKYEEGPVVINQDTCIGCEYCIYACPWGVISRDDITHKATKCTMCSDRISENKSPFCVQACPVEALDFGLQEDISAKAKKRSEEIGGYLYGDKEAGGTQLIYVLKEKKEDYGVRPIGPAKYPQHKIPLALMIKDLFTLRCGIKGKLQALYLALIHPKRLLYRYWPWRRVAAFFLFIGSALFPITEGQAEKIRTAVPQANLNYLSVFVSEAKGFFKEEGLENETVVISGPIATAALLSGDVDYSGAGGSGMRAAIKGAPIKGIMYQTEKVTFYLAVAPNITKPSDLKGKKIAVGVIGDTQDRLITMFAERAGLSSGDITRIAMGPSTPTRILAVKTGSVHAMTVDAAGVILAEKEGLLTLAYLGDLFPFPFQGFVTTDKKIAERPDQVKRWLKAMIRALIFLRERPQEAIDLGAKKLDLGNLSRSMLLDSLKRYLKALPDGVPGLPSKEGIKNALEYDIRIPMGIKGEIAPEKVLNLKLVEEVKREIEMKGLTK